MLAGWNALNAEHRGNTVRKFNSLLHLISLHMKMVGLTFQSC
jgi:hypothetical protein